MNKNRKKRNTAGFSLAETLMAVLILLLASAIVAAGMPMARQAYESAVDAANAQILESTAITVLRDELSTARDILCNEEQTQQSIIMYRSAETGRWNKIVSTHMTTDDGDRINNILIYEFGEADVNASYDNFDAANDEEKGVHYEPEDYRYLVSEKATTQNLSISFGSVSVSNGLITINNLRVYRNGSAAPIAERDVLTIKTIA